MNIKQGLRAAFACALVALGLFGALPAEASVVVAGTRVIFNAQDRETTVKLSNQGRQPALVQAWLDAGDAKASPSSIEVPFTITPPVSRIDPSKSQTLRVLYTGEPLPQDKESVFWLNVLEVPPKPGADMADANTLQLAFRTRIKLFYRPAGLAGTALDAPSQVTWRLVGSGSQLALEARNPTPYYVSYAAVEVVTGDKSVSSRDGGMVGPGETSRFPLAAEAVATVGSKVRFHAINDWGGPVEGESPLTTSP